MNVRISILLLMCIGPIVSHAQSESVDSVKIAGELKADSLALSAYIIADSTNITYSIPTFGFDPSINPPSGYLMSPPPAPGIHGLTFVPGQATVFSWSSGGVTASGGTSSYPGLMQIDNGAIGVYQQAGNFSLYGGATVNKYGYFHGVHTQYGIDGSISYRFSPKVSFTAFGSYYFGRPPVTGGLPMSPAMAGYYGVSKFGGYVDYDAGERVGVLVGGQAVQRVGTDRYEAEPIVTPYVKLGSGKKKVAIGLPVGQILHGLLRR